MSSWRRFAVGASSFGTGPAGPELNLAGADAPLWAWALAFALLPGWRAPGGYRRRRLRGGPAFEVVTREA